MRHQGIRWMKRGKSHLSPAWSAASLRRARQAAEKGNSAMPERETVPCPCIRSRARPGLAPAPTCARAGPVAGAVRNGLCDFAPDCTGGGRALGGRAFAAACQGRCTAPGSGNCLRTLPWPRSACIDSCRPAVGWCAASAVQSAIRLPPSACGSACWKCLRYVACRRPRTVVSGNRTCRSSHRPWQRRRHDRAAHPRPSAPRCVRG